MKKRFVEIKNSRSDDQKKVLEQIISDDVCPFCKENLFNYHKQPILKKGKFWLLTTNQWPYENTKNHLLAIYKDHVEHLLETKAGAGDELFKMFRWASKKYNMPGGALAVRFGSNPELGNYGSTVTHLHAHLIEADLQNPGNNAVKFKVGDPKNRVK